MSGWLDRPAARGWFERAPAGLDADPLAREVERRMAARLEFVRLDPRRIVDVGCGTADGRAALRARYPKADIVLTDAASATLRRTHRTQPLVARVRSAVGAAREHLLCADMTALPIRTASCELVWSNLVLAWSADPAATLAEWHRVLAVGGLLMFSSYGPDTLKELRAAFAAVDLAPHIHPFVDMHDLGDALVASGFAEPVMDMDMLTVTHERVDGLVRDLRASGQRNAHAARRRGLTGPRTWQRMAAAYTALASGGRLPATFEIVYGHAWKPVPRTTADGRAIIRLDVPRRPGKTD
ncbi:MAG TPA: methyltransferase domain-containing protein [Burkholderiales bacterium]|nr:methyltransferase domain-containing protein [Burkholderiales bacterium]